MIVVLRVTISLIERDLCPPQASKESSPLLLHATLLVRPRPVQIRNANMTLPCSSRANIDDGTSSRQVLSNEHFLIERNGRIRADRSTHIGRIAEHAAQAAIDITNGIAAGDGGPQGGHGGGGSHAQRPFVTTD